MAPYLRKPAVLVSLAVIIWLSAALIPSNRTNRSTLASLLNPPRLSTAHGRPVPIVVYRTPAGLEAHIEVEGPSGSPPDAERLTIQFFQDLRRRSGLWALTRESIRLHVWDHDGALAAAEFSTLPGILRDAIEREEHGPVLFARTHDLVRDGVFVRTRTLRRGYVHNALTAPFALLLVIGLVSLAHERLQRARELFERARSAHRVRQGLCQHCGYDSSSWRGETCPECGKSASDP
jgi:hypothetical protein